MGPRLRFRDVVGRATDHGDQFHLPVGVAIGRQGHGGVRPRHRRDELGEHRGRFRDGETGLVGVVTVVEANREDLARCRHRGLQIGGGEFDRLGQLCGRRPRRELVPPLVDRLRVASKTPPLALLTSTAVLGPVTSDRRPPMLAIFMNFSWMSRNGGR